MTKKVLYICIAIINLLLALLVGGRFSYFMFLLTISIYLYAKISTYFIRKNLIVNFWIDNTCINKEDTVVIDYNVYNSSIFPIPFMIVSDEIPKRLSRIASKNEIYQANPFETTIISREIVSEHRGQYDLSELKLKIGDVFGLVKREVILRDPIKLKVYPKIYPLEEYKIDMVKSFGKIISNKKIYEDYSNFRNLKEYIPGDSVKLIDWKASAKNDELYIKKFDSSSKIKIHIYLDFKFSKFKSDKTSDIEEKLAECAISLSYHMLKKGFETVFTTYTEKRVNIAGRNLNAIGSFLEVLSIIRPKSEVGVSEMIKNGHGSEDNDGVIVIITPHIDDSLRKTIAELKMRKINVAVILVGKFIYVKNIKDFEILKELKVKHNIIDINDNISQVLR
ncbi:DUF58 domain-containing protein [Clostridiaceae bacterium M8S5]|nr:DUF58 domain-containing protein [Clostridiaceae bacterium M8S5]